MVGIWSLSLCNCMATHGKQYGPAAELYGKMETIVKMLSDEKSGNKR